MLPVPPRPVEAKDLVFGVVLSEGALVEEKEAADEVDEALEVLFARRAARVERTKAGGTSRGGCSARLRLPAPPRPAKRLRVEDEER
jgi:hypothetical protein